MVRNIRNVMPKLGGKKLYYLLQPELSQLNVGRDKLFRILRANHMLIVRKKNYHITTDSHHRFRKHKNLISSLEIEESVSVSDITYVGTRQNYLFCLFLVILFHPKSMEQFTLYRLTTLQSKILFLNCNLVFFALYFFLFFLLGNPLITCTFIL